MTNRTGTNLLVAFFGVLTLSLPSFASDTFSFLETEIQSLNREYGHAMDYPIVVFNKNAAHTFIKKSGAQSEAQKVAALQNYTLQAHQVSMTSVEASNILPYITQFKDSAVAFPFYEGPKTRVCYVLPSFSQNDHATEIKRVLGDNNASQNIYHNFDTRKAMNWMSLEDLHLFSLYHELSHCFDQVYIRDANMSSGDPHSIHESEVFAEVNALFLLAQKKSRRTLGYSRALLRGVYAQYMGPYLAKQPPSMAGDAYNKGGSIYFLSLALLKAQQLSEARSTRIMELSLQETLELSNSVTQFSAIPSRSFQALHNYFTNGRNAALQQYQEMAQRNPDLFMQAYTDLLAFDAFLKSLELYK